MKQAGSPLNRGKSQNLRYDNVESSSSNHEEPQVSYEQRVEMMR